MNKQLHKPYIAAEKNLPEFTLKAVLLGAFFGLLFGASTTYLALKVGLTVSASIPIAVLSIALFKRWGGATILENNIVQTIGSAGESIAAGVAFTLPALLFLAAGAEFFNYFQIFFLALVGGLLGMLFMVPLRRTLIVEEHGRLPYPEGVACADILVAGEKGGSLAQKVYWGIGIAVIYKFLMSIFGLWKEVPTYIFRKSSALPNAMIAGEITPELLGVGYIIGIRAASTMVAGGVLSFMVLIPLISHFAGSMVEALSPMDIWNQYIRYIGAGAVTFGGIITMIKTFPTIIKTIKETWKVVHASSQKKESTIDRTDRDLPFSYIIIGALLLIGGMLLLPRLPVTWFSSILIVIASFFFVTISSRIVGLIGTSSNPVSGMTIATLMAVSLLFILRGLHSEMYQPIALCVGSIVAIAAANAGATSQDLKTGFLIGATPQKQQVAIIIGVVVAAATVGITITLLRHYVGFGEVTAATPHALPAPQAMLMSTLIKGLFDQSLPWNLVLVGMGIAAVVELCGVNSLAFAVGAYLPLSTTTPIFVGGVINKIVQNRKKIAANQADLESGALFSSGLIAGGALMGIVIAFLLGTLVVKGGSKVALMEWVNLHWADHLGGLGDLLALTAFGILCLLLYFFALKKDH